MAQFPQSYLADSFRSYFTLTPALTEEQREETYRIRHEVYCRDLGWEPLRPDALETDDYDRNSVPCLMSATTTGARAGCLRLILCNQDDPHLLLPLERICAGTIDRSILDLAKVNRLRIAEVSRLAVMRDYRRRKGEAGQAISLEESDLGSETHSRFPFIPMGLFLAAFAMADELGIEQLLVLTEPRLATHLSRIGMDIRPIGNAIDHKGVRLPSVMYTQRTINKLHPMLRRMWKQIRGSIADGFAAAGHGVLPCSPLRQSVHPGPVVPDRYGN